MCEWVPLFGGKKGFTSVCHPEGKAISWMLRTPQLTGWYSLNSLLTLCQMLHKWRAGDFHRVITRIMRLNTITLPWIYSVSKSVTFENNRGAFKLLMTRTFDARHTQGCGITLDFTEQLFKSTYLCCIHNNVSPSHCI